VGDRPPLIPQKKRSLPSRKKESTSYLASDICIEMNRGISYYFVYVRDVSDATGHEKSSGMYQLDTGHESAS
jgi:hypothetical protein